MHENRVFEPNPDFVNSAAVSGMPAYEQLCKEAKEDYEGFWAKLARELLIWHKPFTKTLNEENAPFYKWYEDGELNVSANCLDKHLASGLILFYPQLGVIVLQVLVLSYFKEK
jgi:acetyl-CoA synthetase